MTRHDDPDTTTPIDTTTGQAPLRTQWPVGTRLVGDEGYGPTTIRITYVSAQTILAVNEATGRESMWTLSHRDWKVATDVAPPIAQNVPVSPARVCTPAELDALPHGSVVLGTHGAASQRLVSGWRSAAGGDSRSSDELWRSFGSIPRDRRLTVVHVPDRDLLAEAEARGVARGRREALTDLRRRVYNGAPDPYQAFYNYGLAPLLDAEIDRAGETPGGAA